MSNRSWADDMLGLLLCAVIIGLYYWYITIPIIIIIVLIALLSD